MSTFVDKANEAQRSLLIGGDGLQRPGRFDFEIQIEPNEVESLEC